MSTTQADNATTQNATQAIKYFEIAGLTQEQQDSFAQHQQENPNIVATYLKTYSGLPELKWEQIEKLYTYDVPLLYNETEGCARKVKDPIKFNLATQVYKLEYAFDALTAHKQTQRLHLLNKLVQQVHSVVQCDWIGIYCATNYSRVPNVTDAPCLIKEAYVGEYSRADFPLNTTFAKLSTNAHVGLYRCVRIIPDTQQLNANDPYYVCDTRIRSEFCAPILHPVTKQVIGIIDAESTVPNFFCWENAKNINFLIAACLELGQNNLFL